MTRVVASEKDLAIKKLQKSSTQENVKHNSNVSQRKLAATTTLPEKLIIQSKLATYHPSSVEDFQERKDVDSRNCLPTGCPGTPKSSTDALHLKTRTPLSSFTSDSPTQETLQKTASNTSSANPDNTVKLPNIKYDKYSKRPLGT
jgi:hypothetical protein